MLQMLRVFLLCSSVLFILSCSRKEQKADAQRAVLSAATGMDQIQVETIDERGFRQLVTQRNGKALFVSLWATWCEPCKEEFPDIVRLSNEVPPSEIDFVAISLDDPDEVESKVIPFLRENKITLKVYVADVKDQESFINTVNSVWSGALPATILYDGKGRRKSFLVGQQDYETFKKEIGKLRQSS
jgi:thiol-disulfide isomerase/thioredoxin